MFARSPSSSRKVPGRLALAVVAAALALTGCSRTTPAPERPVVWSSAVLVERGERALAEGDGARAEQYLSFAIDRGASIDEVLPLLLQACIAGDRLETALVHAERHRDAVTDVGRLDTLIAALHLALGERERAIEVADEAIARGRAPALAFYLRATARAGQGGDARRTREDFKRYLTLAPDGRYRAEARRTVGGGGR
jgi:tetratricopeptide (TPR) repeat protein